MVTFSGHLFGSPISAKLSAEKSAEASYFRNQRLKRFPALTRKKYESITEMQLTQLTVSNLARLLIFTGRRTENQDLYHIRFQDSNLPIHLRSLKHTSLKALGALDWDSTKKKSIGFIPTSLLEMSSTKEHSSAAASALTSAACRAQRLADHFARWEVDRLGWICQTGLQDLHQKPHGFSMILGGSLWTGYRVPGERPGMT